MKDDYNKLLERAYKEIKISEGDASRWQLPEPNIEIQGNRTVIKNFKELCNFMNRDFHHFSKWLSRKFGAPCFLLGDKLVIQGRRKPDEIRATIQLYIQDYVKCPICGSCDTQLVKEGRYLVLKCEACGAISPVKEI